MPRPKSIPIVIPESLTTDRAVRNLITQWRNLHYRHRECRKRVSWSNRKASVIEKRRRREQWEIVARTLEIERQMLIWAARATKHPDIYTPTKGSNTSRKVSPRKIADRSNVSRMASLRFAYDLNRSEAHHLTGPHKRSLRRQRREERKAIVAEMRAITRSWLVAIYQSVYPDGTPPQPLPLHPAELVPRKLKRAQRLIKREIAA